ncbi:MAG: hypothetical protein IK088_03160, partial [Lachnospiraceae bacterium]|nr:hypothetical protein [Lachnospiraceae bacterium]
MRKVVWLSTAVKAVIVILAVILILLAWPFRVFRFKETQSVPVTSGTTSSLINRNNYVKQIFFANGTHMDSMRLCVMQGNEGTFEVRFYDVKQKQLAIEEIKIPESLPAYVRVPVDLDMIEDGQTPYFFKVSVPEDSDTGLTISMEPWGANPNVISVAYYNETPLQGMNYAADYTYSRPFDLLRTSLLIGTVLLVMFIALALTDRIFEKRNRLVTVEGVVKAIA